ncbi:hypothetical protein [Acinetobacter junii]|uniref:hypothetical protein n=1 Tax=Acinetobacter junii TaxID=40215 RepID=UPI003019382E
MSFSFTEPFGDNPDEMYEKFVKVLNELISDLNIFIDKAEYNNEVRDSNVLINKLVEIKSLKKFLEENFKTFFIENKNLLHYNIVGKTIFNYILDVKNKIPLRIVEILPADLTDVLFPLRDLVEAFNTIKNFNIRDQQANQLIIQLKEQVERATLGAQNVESAVLAIESDGTDKIYKDLSDKYRDEYELNNEYFRNSIILTGCCTLLSIIYTLNIPVNEINWVAFVSIKVLIVAVGITLCTLFLRRSAHAKKLHEKAYQTHVEINAYPIFIKSLKEDDQHEITKELALRYFGNDIDQTQNDKIGDLMQDQLLAGTELIKASAELVKAKQVNGAEG